MGAQRVGGECVRRELVRHRGRRRAAAANRRVIAGFSQPDKHPARFAEKRPAKRRTGGHLEPVTGVARSSMMTRPSSSHGPAYATARAGGRGTRRLLATRTSTIEGHWRLAATRPLPQALARRLRLPCDELENDRLCQLKTRQRQLAPGRFQPSRCRHGPRRTPGQRPQIRNRSARAFAASRVSATPVMNAMLARDLGPRRARRRRLKTASSTGPVVPDRRVPASRAAGSAGVRPRPRNLARSVSYSGAPLCSP
jgi:hypothetical protein